MEKYTATALCLALLLATAFLAAQEANPADFNGDGMVDFNDFLIFARGFGKSAGDADFNAKLDLDGDGTIDFGDFLRFVDAFGESSVPTDPPPDDGPLLLYIADLTNDNIQVLNTETNLLDPTRMLRAAQPRGIALSNTNAQIYVAAIDSFHAFGEDGSPAFQLSLKPPARPSRGGYRVVLSPDHQFAYLTEESGAAVEVIDILAGQSLDLIDVPPSPSGIVISPDGARLYVGHGHGASAVSVIDTRIPALIDSIAVGQAVSRLALSPDGQTLYLNSLSTGRLLKVDATTKAIADSLSLGQATDQIVSVLDVALSADGTRLAASLGRTFSGFDAMGNVAPVLWGGIAVIDTRTWEQTAEIFLGAFVANIGMTPDGKTLYVAGIESLGAPAPSLQLFIVDLENEVALGTIRGFAVPVAFSFNSSKPAIPNFQSPELIVF